MIESKDFEELFASLKDHDVRYLVVGGYAVAVHARPRFTDDLIASKQAAGRPKDREDLRLLRLGAG